jgi:hypothetical protein
MRVTCAAVWSFNLLMRSGDGLTSMVASHNGRSTSNPWKQLNPVDGNRLGSGQLIGRSRPSSSEPVLPRSAVSRRRKCFLTQAGPPDAEAVGG